MKFHLRLKHNFIPKKVSTKNLADQEDEVIKQQEEAQPADNQERTKPKG